MINKKAMSKLVFFFCFFFLVSVIQLFPATGSPNNTWHGLMRFLDAGKGSHVDGLAELKVYLRRFGYLPHNTTITDIFDEKLETALLSYQKNLGLPETGKLDQPTMRAIGSPRCGVSDHQLPHRFAYFDGMPHWALRSPMTLSYAFSPPPNVIDYVSLPDLKAAFGRAFSRWSAVIPVSFTEAADYSHADIRIRWYSGEHGDGLPFDGPLGVLAHAFAPENGNLHLDAAERWAVDLAAEGSQAAVDLESVATHEIGHILGLQHSSNSDAVMYATLSPRTKKVELRKDDVDGVQGLYGSKPGYRFVPVSEPSSSSGRMMKWNFASPWLSWLVLLVFRIY